ncbi:MAG: hypothetical protein VKM92_08100 [Cyanobacteriota bacterium]|nr:hypothetical protein [Cyanobacteriota bacterium]
MPTWAIDSGHRLQTNDGTSMDLDSSPTAMAQLEQLLPADLRLAIELQAQAEGLESVELISRLIQAGAMAEGISVAGRCSLRTGLCSEGPRPLPLQQSP